MQKLKILPLSVCGLVLIIFSGQVHGQIEKQSLPTSTEELPFKPWEVSVDILKSYAYGFDRTLYMQAGVAHRFHKIHRVRLELGFARKTPDTVWTNVLYSAQGSFARLYYTLDVIGPLQAYAGLQAGAYRETYKVHLEGTNFSDYHSETLFKERYAGILTGLSLQHQFHEWFGVRMFSQTGIYAFKDAERVSPENFERRRVIGNIAPINTGPNRFLTIDCGVEMLFYF